MPAATALIDAGALIALARTRDQYHERARAIVEDHLAAGGRFIGTVLVLGEFHAHMLHRVGPAAARRALTLLLADPVHAWEEVAHDLVADATDRWLTRFADQPFTLVDAVSFEVMRRAGVRHAFAFDRHFEIAGFELLT